MDVKHSEKSSKNISLLNGKVGTIFGNGSIKVDEFQENLGI
jgi:hypothetical protein